ncbi:hypothetical protein B6E78_01565 [Edwardsiella ictaluri]|nr:hypothetical protein B6E78_01565 [Edwardsiella ictaluri]
MNSIDSQRYQWASGYSRNTRDDNFAFSIAEEAFFIVGLHPFAHRLSRNFKCPVLVFNHHEIFSALRLSGHFDKYKAAIRKNEMHIQGSVNRQLSDFGKNQKLRNMPVLTKIFYQNMVFKEALKMTVGLLLVFISSGLLVAIGAQNTFVIRQGVKREFVFTVSATCFICDFILMCVGVLGVGEVVNKNEILLSLLTVAGVLFLLWYGIRSLKSAYYGESILISNGDAVKSTLSKIIITTVSFSLLNPNIWIDTVAIVGGVSSTIDETQRINYLAGALTASFIWFFSIGYLAAWLSKIFIRPLFWRMGDFLIGLYMLYIAWSLLLFLTNDISFMAA